MSIEIGVGNELKPEHKRVDDSKTGVQSGHLRYEAADTADRNGISRQAQTRPLFEQRRQNSKSNDVSTSIREA